MGVIEDAGPEHLSFEREDFPPVCVMVPACVRVAEGNRELAGRVALTGHLGLDDIRIPAETMPGMRANNMATNNLKLYRINGDSLPRCFEPSNVKAELRDTESVNLKPLVSRSWLRGTC